MSRAMTLLALLVVCLIALGLGFAAYVRLAPSDPGRWHVDPLTAPDPTSPNFARIDRLVALSGEDVEWESLERREGFAGWSDDYASILPILRPIRMPWQ